jgi:hypothetical protein
MKVQLPAWTCVSLVFWLALAGACSPKNEPGAGAGANAGTSGSGGSAGSGGRGGPGGGGSGGAAGAGAAFGVLIDASRTMLCPGQCAELSASAHDGRAPFSYSWSLDIGEGAGPHEVCPTESTTYMVTARDFGLEDDEFGGESQEASAAIEVRVVESCEPMMDAGTDERPDDPQHVCDLELTYGANAWVATLTGWEGGSNLIADREGNMFIAGGFGGTIEVAGKTLSSEGMTDSFVMKIDSDCELLWIVAFGEQSAQVNLGAIGVGPDGDPVVGGAVMGSATIGGNAFAVGDNPAGLLLKLDGSDGSVLWSNVYASFFFSAGIWDVGIDDDDNVVISGYAAADVSFGGAPIGGPGGNVTFLTKLTSSGAHVFSQAIATSNLWLPIAVHGSGDIAAGGWITGGTEIGIGGGTVLLTNGQWSRYGVLLDGNGMLRWATTFGADDDAEAVGWWGGGLAIDRERNVLIEHGGYDQMLDGTLQPEPTTITKLSAQGDVLWTRVMDDLGYTEFYAQGGVATNSSGDVVHVDEVPEADAGPVMPDSGPPLSDVAVRKLTADGEPVWTRRLGSSGYEWAWGIAVDVDDAIWVAHVEEADAQSGDGRLLVSKLAP